MENDIDIDILNELNNDLNNIITDKHIIDKNIVDNISDDTDFNNNYNDEDEDDYLSQVNISSQLILPSEDYTSSLSWSNYLNSISLQNENIASFENDITKFNNQIQISNDIIKPRSDIPSIIVLNENDIDLVKLNILKQNIEEIKKIEEENDKIYKDREIERNRLLEEAKLEKLKAEIIEKEMIINNNTIISPIISYSDNLIPSINDSVSVNIIDKPNKPSDEINNKMELMQKELQRKGEERLEKEKLIKLKTILRRERTDMIKHDNISFKLRDFTIFNNNKEIYTKEREFMINEDLRANNLRDKQRDKLSQIWRRECIAMNKEGELADKQILIEKQRRAAELVKLFEFGMKWLLVTYKKYQDHINENQQKEKMLAYLLTKSNNIKSNPVISPSINNLTKEIRVYPLPISQLHDNSNNNSDLNVGIEDSFNSNSKKVSEDLIDVVETFESNPLDLILSINGYDENVEKIELSLENITEINGLSNFKSIQSLLLPHNLIKNISGLENLSSLTELNLKDNKISSMNGLSFNNNLNVLDLGINKIRKISGLDKCKLLRNLDLNHNAITDLSGLINSIKLQELNLFHNSLTGKLPSLNHIPTLQILDLCQNKLNDVFESIKSLNFLSKLMLSNNLLKSAPIIKFHVLRELWLNNNKLTVAPHLECPLLERCFLQDNSITIVPENAFENCICLKILDLSFNSINNVDFLKKLINCKRLQSIALNDNPANNYKMFCLSHLSINELDSQPIEPDEIAAFKRYSNLSVFLENNNLFLNSVNYPWKFNMIRNSASSFNIMNYTHFNYMAVQESYLIETAENPSFSNKLKFNLDDQNLFKIPYFLLSSFNLFASRSPMKPLYSPFENMCYSHSIEYSKQTTKRLSISEGKNYIQQIELANKQFEEHACFKAELWRYRLVWNKSYRKKIQLIASINIQRYWRGYLARRNLKLSKNKKSASVAIIAAYWRGYFFRKKTNILNYIREIVQIKSQAAIKIQKIWRGFYVRYKLNEAKKKAYEFDDDGFDYGGVDMDNFNYTVSEIDPFKALERNTNINTNNNDVLDFILNKKPLPSTTIHMPLANRDPATVNKFTPVPPPFSSLNSTNIFRKDFILDTLNNSQTKGSVKKIDQFDDMEVMSVGDPDEHKKSYLESVKEKWHLKDDASAESFLALQKKRNKTKNKKKLENMGPMERLHHINKNVPLIVDHYKTLEHSKPLGPVIKLPKVGNWSTKDIQPTQFTAINSSPSINVNHIKDFDLRPASTSTTIELNEHNQFTYSLPPLVMKSNVKRH